MKIRGFTLIELVAAVSILSIGIAAVVRSFIGFSDGFNALENQAQAAVFLEGKLAQTLAGFSADGRLLRNEDGGNTLINNRNASWSLQSATVMDNPFGKDLEALTVRVNWKESGRVKEMSVTRLIRQQGERRQ